MKKKQKMEHEYPFSIFDFSLTSKIGNAVFFSKSKMKREKPKTD